MVHNVVEGFADSAFGVDGKSQVFEMVKGFGVGVKGRVRGAEEVGEKAEPAFGHQAGVPQFERAGGGIAGVGKGSFTGFFAFAVDGLEGFVGEVDFAADLAAVNGFSEADRDGGNGFDVGGDIFAPDAVAPGDAAEQEAVFVGEAEGHAVDFEFSDVTEIFAWEFAADAGFELPEFVFGVGVVQAEHRDVVDNGGKGFTQVGADALGGGIGADEVGVFGFEVDEFPEEPIEVLVRDDGGAQDIVPVVVFVEFPDESVDVVCRLFRHPFCLIRLF